MKTVLSHIFVLFCMLVSCNQNAQKNIQVLAPDAFASKIKVETNLQLIDVRTPEEYQKDHINQAQNINWNDSKFEDQIVKLDKTKPVFVYCLAGGRSAKAAQKLSDLGFTQIYDLEGGMLKWNASGAAQQPEKIIGMCAQEYNEMLNTDKKVLVDFYAEWCGPCKKMAPYLKKIQEEMGDKVTIVRLDVDQHKTMAKEMKIEALPTLVLYQNQKIIWQYSGYISKEDLEKHLK